MTTKTVNLYTFDELSDKAKERARDWWRELEAQDFGGFDEINEPIETAAKILGIELRTHPVRLHGGGTRYESDIYWTLHVQGAGASFNAFYRYAKGSSKAIRAEFGTDTKLHAIADDLAELQKRNGYRLEATISSDHRGHFLSVDADKCESELKEIFDSFAHWMYKLIDAEYEYRMSDENVDDSIRANEYTFTDEGRRED